MNATVRTLIQGGLVIACTNVWTDTGRKLIAAVFPEPKQNLVASVVYALMVTLFVIVLIEFTTFTFQASATVAPQLGALVRAR